ncbi:glutamine--fructose-6-phosphate aminotransferase, partial [Burkholderia pseudomallei]
LKDGECFLASDALALALAGINDQFIFLDEGDIVELTPRGARFVDRDGRPVVRAVQSVSAAQGAAELGEYRHFMQK